MIEVQFTSTDPPEKGCGPLSPTSPPRTLTGGADPENAPENPGRRAMLRTVLGGAALTVTGAERSNAIPQAGREQTAELRAAADAAYAAALAWEAYAGGVLDGHTPPGYDPQRDNELLDEARRAVENLGALILAPVRALHTDLEQRGTGETHWYAVGDIGSMLLAHVTREWCGINCETGDVWPAKAEVAP